MRGAASDQTSGSFARQCQPAPGAAVRLSDAVQSAGRQQARADPDRGLVGPEVRSPLAVAACLGMGAWLCTADLRGGPSAASAEQPAGAARVLVDAAHAFG